MRVMCVDYRLAPQHSFPAGLDDALAVYKALIKSEGYTASSIGFIGDSAGGQQHLATHIGIRSSNVGCQASGVQMSVAQPRKQQERAVSTHCTLHTTS